MKTDENTNEKKNVGWVDGKRAIEMVEMRWQIYTES